MKSELQISNAVANVIKFAAIEALLAVLIEPAIAEINRIRAQRIALAGKPVRIHTSFLHRDFSGPAVGGRRGVFVKLCVLFALLAAVLATEFAFDYTVRTAVIGERVVLTGLSSTVEPPPFPSRPDGSYTLYEANLSRNLFNLVKCSYRNGTFRYERRLMPNGECYEGDKTGFHFPEPCVTNPNERIRHNCLRTADGIVKKDNDFEDQTWDREISRLYKSNATYVFIQPAWYGEFTPFYLGRKEKDGNDVRYCSSNRTGNNKSICLTFLNETGDGWITGYDVVQGTGPVKENIQVAPLFANSPTVRIGADTFDAAPCGRCLWRISFMVDLVASTMQVKLFDLGISAPFEDIGIAVAMMALGMPAEVGKVADPRFTEQVGFLIIDWRFVVPLAVITGAAVVLRLSGLMMKNVVKMPLDYSSAMHYARNQEMGGKEPKNERSEHTYDVGLVQTCEKNALFLSMNAKQTAAYNGDRIVDTKMDCGNTDCTRCQRIECDSEDSHSASNVSAMRKSEEIEDMESGRFRTHFGRSEQAGAFRRHKSAYPSL